MSEAIITPLQARELIAAGAVLIDIREADEYAREHIAGAQHVPLANLTQQLPSMKDAPAVIFHCRSGGRTRSHANTLLASADCDAYLLEGGIDAWKQAGFSVVTDHTQPLELNRQVQITAGLLILIGVSLGTSVSPGFYLISALVGAGLSFAGITGTCGLASLLRWMPWNRRGMTS